MDNENVEFRKQFNDNVKKSKENSKLSYCLYCKKECTSFCNSHSLPRYILKNISSNGMILSSNAFLKMPLIDSEIGVNKSGTFQRICRQCDSIVFKDYEKPEKIMEFPYKKIMAEIDLKNTLRMYDKRLNEIELYKIGFSLTDDDGDWNDLLERQKINYLDLNEIREEFNYATNILNKQTSDSYDLIFFEKLSYVVSIAFQGHIALYGDLSGNIINDLYNYNKSTIIENLNLCVFPLETETIIIMFISKKNKKYNNFISQFKKLRINEKLRLISYIIFKYSEDFFISKQAKNELLNNKILDVVTQDTTEIYAFDEKMAEIIGKEKRNDLIDYKKFPNLLDIEFRIK